MNVISLKTNNTIKSVHVFTQRGNELEMSDIKKMIPNRIDVLYPGRISRLAYIYVMFAEKDAVSRPVNKVASALLDNERSVRGDVVIARTNHLGHNAKIFALEDNEIPDIVDRISKLFGSKVELVVERR